MKRDFLSLSDLTQGEIQDLLQATARIKVERTRKSLAGKSVGMIFNKPSTRTRISFEVGIHELGGQAVYMHGSETQLSRDEPISHTARVLSRYLDAVVIRTFHQHELVELAKWASIPVVNALTDQFHPCQVLSDMFTMVEKKGRVEGLKVAWIGDGNNMANSWIVAAGICGFELALAVPEGYDPDPEVLKKARAAANHPILVTRDPVEAAQGADVINTDVWASMGQENETEQRAKVFRPYQVGADLVARAAPDAIVMHCLPAHPGMEITEEVLEGPHSVVFDQAENRLHAQKALLEFLLPGGDRD